MFTIFRIETDGVEKKSIGAVKLARLSDGQIAGATEISSEKKIEK